MFFLCLCVIKAFKGGQEGTRRARFIQEGRRASFFKEDRRAGGREGKISEGGQVSKGGQTKCPSMTEAC